MRPPIKRYRTTPHALVLTAALLLAATSTFARGEDAPKKEETPIQIIDRLSKEVVGILGNKELSPKDKRVKIQDIAFASIDFPALSRLTLGKNWRGLTDAQREEFMKEYRVHLANTYRSMIDNYKDEQVKTTGDREETGGDRTVLTKVNDPKSSEEFKVDYRLRHEAEGWRIIDITIEGISLAANFRAQFQEIIGNGGFDLLMKTLLEKNAAAEKDQK
jgi:phospholipid transport system substrate-binding protein